MKGVSALVWIGLAGVASIAMFHIKFEVEQLQGALNGLNKHAAKNVCYHKRWQKFQSYVRINQKMIHIGCYADEQEALLTSAAFKEVAFHLQYLVKATDEPRASEGRRAYLHGNKDSFALAVERLGPRVRRRPTLRKALATLHRLLHTPAALREKFVADLEKEPDGGGRVDPTNLAGHCGNPSVRDDEGGQAAGESTPLGGHA